MILFERCLERSMPISAVTCLTYGFTPVGVIPALSALNLSPQRWFRKASAICERAELWVQRNRTVINVWLPSVL